jgi:hypothetical protein
VPGPLVTTAALVLCPHTFKATAQRPSTRVTIAGAPATTVGAPWQVACMVPEPTPKCTLVTFAPGAARVLIEGFPAILKDTVGICPPNGNAQIPTTQQRVTGQ